MVGAVINVLGIQPTVWVETQREALFPIVREKYELQQSASFSYGLFVYYLAGWFQSGFFICRVQATGSLAVMCWELE